jgi:diadenosine tetraphosphatase ApaH/serine/threonine PP2A family protein phosphatase
MSCRKYAKFEDYLEEKHAEQYDGLDDEMPDNYAEWLSDLDPEDVIRYADEFFKEFREEIDRLTVDPAERPMLLNEIAGLHIQLAEKEKEVQDAFPWNPTPNGEPSLTPLENAKKQYLDSQARITLLEGLVQEMMTVVEMFAPGSKLLTHATKVMEAK